MTSHPPELQISVCPGPDEMAKIMENWRTEMGPNYYMPFADWVIARLKAANGEKALL